MQMKSLKARAAHLSESEHQIEVLEHTSGVLSFKNKIAEFGYQSLKPTIPEVLQINVGKMCNQVCKHCHVDAGPDRKEIMTRDTMKLCLDILEKNPEFQTVDLTGGAPEMNPDFRWFVEEIKALERHVMVRCNLTIILANLKYHDLPYFFKNHQIEVVSSLPFYSKRRTDSQRGEGVFGKSVEALQLLNEAGYGKPDTGLILNLVYNPSGAFMPPNQSELEREFKEKLFQDFGIVFNELFAITNLPISRFLDYLLASENYETYMQKLVNSFNPEAVQNVMCRNMVSVSWDGFLYDCDFNQMLDMKIACKGQHLTSFNMKEFMQRNIVINNHCYGCTAGAGSSCGGAVTE